MPSTPTLRDVAAKAGVSHMTVSRVVRGLNLVSPATASKVQAAIRVLAYRPDPMLSALANRRTALRRRSSPGLSLAFIDCDGTAYSRSVLQACRAEAAQFGYGLDAFRLPASPQSRRRLSQVLHSRGVPGILFGPASHPLDLTSWDWSSFSAVSLGPLSHSPALHGVGLDYHESVLTALSGLNAQGLRRPGLCLRSELDERTGGRWKGAFLAASPGPRPLLFRDDAELRSRLVKWIHSENVDAILTADGRYQAIYDRAGLPVAYLNHYQIPKGLAHISLDAELIGVEGVRMLHLLVLRRETSPPSLPRVIHLRGRWVGDERSRKR